MDSLLWTLKTYDVFGEVSPLLVSLLIAFIMVQSDFILLLMAWFVRLTFGKADSFVSGAKPCHDGLVIIPSLLRNQDDYDAIVTAVDSCAHNHYPSKLAIIVSVDGCEEFPEWCEKLVDWGSSRSYPQNVYLYVMGLPSRRGKIMAIDAACKYMTDLVDQGVHQKFPVVYFSMDGDSVLSENALERLAIRLTTPHRLTGNLRRVVSGKIYIRKDLVWNGWRQFFTVKGQIYSQVSREFVTKNVARYNWRIMPRFGLSGALYVTWSEVLIQAPRYMGFLSTIKLKDCIKWYFGCAPPLFSETQAPPIPEALTGSTDDTSMACLAVIARWKNGALSFDAPRTPLHSIGRFLMEWLIDRSHDYDPRAIVYTYTPSTVKGLWNQRVRWNSSRPECFMRFARALLFHYDLASMAWWQVYFIFRNVFSNVILWIILPFIFFNGHYTFTALFLSYLASITGASIFFVMALMLETEYRSYYKSMFSIPCSPIYNKIMGVSTMVFGIVKDVLVSGNRVLFVPEETLIKGNSQRVAILYRIRRFISMCIRSMRSGDVPFGTWWFGFRECHPYVESGYKGWTSGKRRHYILK